MNKLYGTMDLSYEQSSVISNNIGGIVEQNIQTSSDVPNMPTLNGHMTISDDDEDMDNDGGIQFASSSVKRSFFDCVVEGDASGVAKYLDANPALVDIPFRLSALTNVVNTQNYPDPSLCYCWQYFEVGYQVDNLAGFYPGTLSWQSRVYPPKSTNKSDQTLRESANSLEADLPADVSPVDDLLDRDLPLTLKEISSRLSSFFLSLKVKEVSSVGQVRICSCRKEDSLRLLIDNLSTFHDDNNLVRLLNDTKMMNKLAVSYPLHLATMLGHKKVVDTLITNGANLSKKTKACGLQAIHIAVMYRRRACLQALIEAGADVNAYGFYTSELFEDSKEEEKVDEDHNSVMASAEEHIIRTCVVGSMMLL